MWLTPWFHSYAQESFICTLTYTSTCIPVAKPLFDALFLCVSMHEYMNICMYVCTCIPVAKPLFDALFPPLLLDMNTLAQPHYLEACKHMYVCIYVCMCVYMYVCMYVYITVLLNPTT